jgi:hypothetical protein
MHIVKRQTGIAEPYDEHKLYNSIYASCLAVRTPLGEAEITAKKICQHVLAWLTGKAEVTSLDVRNRASQHLSVYNPDAAYVYLHHLITAT